MKFYHGDHVLFRRGAARYYGTVARQHTLSSGYVIDIYTLQEDNADPQYYFGEDSFVMFALESEISFQRQGLPTVNKKIFNPEITQEDLDAEYEELMKLKRELE